MNSDPADVEMSGDNLLSPDDPAQRKVVFWLAVDIRSRQVTLVATAALAKLYVRSCTPTQNANVLIVENAGSRGASSTNDFAHRRCSGRVGNRWHHHHVCRGLVAGRPESILPITCPHASK